MTRHRTAWASLAACAVILIGTTDPFAADPAKPPAAADPKVAVAETKVSTKTSPGSPTSVEEMYPGATLRDPFARIEGGKESGPVATLMSPDDFSIHNLVLKGIMEDRNGGFAILVDPKFGASFVLKKGRLFDSKNKKVLHVSGTVKAKQRTVELVGYDGDKQTLIMAEPKDEASGGAAGGRAADSSPFSAPSSGGSSSPSSSGSAAPAAAAPPAAESAPSGGAKPSR